MIRYLSLIILLILISSNFSYSQTVYPAEGYEYIGPNVTPTAPISPAGSTLVESSDLPLTITSDDQIFYLDGNVTTSGTAITINSQVNRIRFNGNGDTIFFGTGNGNATSGLAFQLWGSNITDIHFQNVTFYHLPSDTSADSTYAFRILSNVSKRIRFDTCNFHVFGKRDSSSILEDSSFVAGEAQAVSDQGNAGADQQSVIFYGGSMTATAWGYENRMHEDGFTVVVKASNTDIVDNDSIYNYIFHDVNVEGIGGMSVEGRTWVSACSISVDARNLRYWRSNYGNWDAHQGCANQAGLASGDAVAPSRWTNNYIVAGYDNEGMDEGIILDGACLKRSITNADSVVQIDSNYVKVHFRVDPSYQLDLYAKPTTFRYGNKDAWVHHNTFIAEVGDTNSDSAWGPNSWLLKWNASPDVESSRGKDSNFVYENNYHEIVPKTSTLTMGHQEFIGLAFNVDDNGDSAEYKPEDYDIHFRYNYIKTPQWAYTFGSSDGCSQFMNRCYGDTIEFFVSDTSIVHYTAVNHPAGYGEGNLGYYNYVKDVTYTGTGEPDSLISLYPGFSGLSLGLQRTLSILVLKDGSPVNGASLWVVNNYSDTIVDTTTGANGLIEPIVKYYEEFSDYPDSTSYNDFTFGAAYDGDTSTTKFTVNWDTYTDTIVLSPTTGESSRWNILKGIKR